MFIYMQVRHAQGFHNVAGEKDHGAYMSPDLFDAALTPLGWEQVILDYVSCSCVSLELGFESQFP